MIKKIFYSVIITSGIVIVVGLLGYFLVPCVSLNKYLTADSARYVFSAVAQSLAAIFALTFVVTGWITSLTAKDLARHVFKYVFSLKATWVTIFLFVVSIVLNLVYLGLTDETIIGYSSFAHYSYGLFASIFLFTISISFLIWYAAKTYSVSVAPFGCFYDLLKKGITPSLESLRKYVDLSLSVIDIEEKSKLESSLEWVREDIQDQLIRCRDKEGFLTFIDTNSVNMAHHLIKENSSTGGKIYYLAQIGERIQKNRAVFSFEPIDPETDKKITELLSKAFKIESNQPGWVNEFEYIDPLFEVVKSRIVNTSKLKVHVGRLLDLARYYISSKANILGEFEENLKGFKCFWFLDHWFGGYYELIKESCIVRGELARSGRLLEWKDEPDVFIVNGLHRLVYYLYKFNAAKYFQKALLTVLRYSQFISQIDKEINNNIKYLKELRKVINNVSSSAKNEFKLSRSLINLDGYVNYIVKEYLETFKTLIDKSSSTYESIFAEYNYLYEHFVENIEDELTGPPSEDNLAAMERIKILLLSMIFILMVYVLRQVKESNFNKEIYITMHNRFWGKYQHVHIFDNLGRMSYIQVENILEYSLRILDDELGWFVSRMNLDDKYIDFRPMPDTRVRTDEYCHYVYLFTLCLSAFTVTLDKSYWYPDKIKTLRHYYIEFRQEVAKPGSNFHHIFLKFSGHTIDKLQNNLEKLDKLFGEDNAQPPPT